MKIFALETDVTALKSTFLVEGEQELLTVHHHWISFVVHMMRELIVLLLLAVLAGIAAMELLPALAVMVIGMALGAVFIVIFINALIQWRYNFLIVTTEKVVCVTQISVFHQEIKPISHENIASSRSESQFFGLVRAGILYINLKQRLQGSSQELVLRDMPKPDEITGIIENALVVTRQKQRPQDSQATPATQIPEIQQQAANAAVE